MRAIKRKNKSHITRIFSTSDNNNNITIIKNNIIFVYMCNNKMKCYDSVVTIYFEKKQQNTVRKLITTIIIISIYIWIYKCIYICIDIQWFICILECKNTSKQFQHVLCCFHAIIFLFFLFLSSVANIYKKIEQ